jgi:hypothetical protein
MKRPYLLAVGMLAFTALIAPSTAAAQAEPEKEFTTVPLQKTVWVSCANGGAGESVDLGGSLRFRTFTNTDGNGGLHVRMHVQPDGVTGVGQSTGAKYRGTGGTIELSFEAEDGVAGNYTLVNNFRIIGQGRGNNFLVHTTMHSTVNANGEVTASFNVTSAECR